MEGGWRWYATSATCIRTSEKFQKNHKCSNKKNIKKKTPSSGHRSTFQEPKNTSEFLTTPLRQNAGLLHLPRPGLHPGGQNMKVKEELKKVSSFFVSFFGARILSHSQFCLSTQRTSTNCDSNHESRTGKQQLWNFQVPSIQSLYNMYFVIIY